MSKKKSEEKPESAVNVYVEGSESQFVLHDGTIIDLAIMDEWEKLTAHQRLYVKTYMQQFLKYTIAAFICGLSPNKVKDWFNNDDNFASVINVVNDIYGDILGHQDFRSALYDGGRRDAVLGSLKRKGYYKDENKGPNTIGAINVYNFTDSDGNQKQMGKLAGAVKMIEQRTNPQSD